MPLAEDMTPCTICGRPNLWGTRHHTCGTLLLDVMRAADKYWEASIAARHRVRDELEVAVTSALRSAATKGADHA